MISQLTIENYKSIQSLTLNVGRVNVLIGENGCGKSNILEAITFAAAAEADKLDKNSLEIRSLFKRLFRWIANRVLKIMKKFALACENSKTGKVVIKNILRGYFAIQNPQQEIAELSPPEGG